MDSDLSSAAKVLSASLASRGQMLVTAESCTGGWVGQVLTAIPGSSAWYDRGFITYSNDAKQDMLGVSEQTLRKFGAVSVETADAMARGALANSRASIALAVTGVAGPSGGTERNPVGTVCFAWASRARMKGGGDDPGRDWTDVACTTARMRFDGDRERVRYQAVRVALDGALRCAEGSAA